MNTTTKTITEQLADALRAILAVDDKRNEQELVPDGDAYNEVVEHALGAREAIAAYDAQPSWSEDDARLAASEGWCVSDTSDGFAEIQRIDEAEVFGEDAQAIAHVYWMAGTGSELHKRAIAYTLRDGNTWTYTQAPCRRW